MKGILDILHAWKNVFWHDFNPSPQREYVFVVDKIPVFIEKNGGAIAYFTYRLGGVTSRSMLSAPSTGFTFRYIDPGSVAKIEWDENITYLAVNGKKIIA